MGRIIKRSYIVDLINKLYINQELLFLSKIEFLFLHCIEQQLREKKFNSDNPNINEWFMVKLR